MTIDALAEQYRLKITRDECNDKIIQGRKGHLYADAGKVCAMWIDALVILEGTLKQLGGKVWVGDKSPGPRGRMVRDAKVTGISLDKIPLAIRLTGCKFRRVMSEAQLAAAAKGRARSPIGKRKETHCH